MMINDTEALAAAIRAARARKNMTQRELAREAGVSAAYISRLENGHTDGRYTTIRKLAKPLDLDLGDLEG